MLDARQSFDSSYPVIDY